MSTIEKLGIAGLRSYSSERNEVIDFLKPVTLILGKNGSGKTTIIEALRFAICGLMPPSSNNGKTFVNDPRLKGKTEGKAAVKLKFRAINEKPVLCIRSMQLSYTSHKEELKKVEQFLKIKHTSGEIVTIGHTCTEIDKQMPELLGVSKAILENVVLCHQEESLWPFADNMTLKKVFDDLFDTARIAKFSEQINAAIKNQKKELKEERNVMELAKRDYQRYTSLKDEFGYNLDRILELRKEIALLESKVSRDKDLEQFNDLQRRIGSCQTFHANYTAKLSHIQSGLDNFKGWKPSIVAMVVLDPGFPSQVVQQPKLILQKLTALIFEGDAFNAFSSKSSEETKSLKGLVDDYKTEKARRSYQPNGQQPPARPLPLAHHNDRRCLEDIMAVTNSSLSGIKETTDRLTAELAEVSANLRLNDVKATVEEIKALIKEILNKRLEEFELTSEVHLSNLQSGLEKSKNALEDGYQQILLMLAKLGDEQSAEQAKLADRERLLDRKLQEFQIQEVLQEQLVMERKLKDELMSLETNTQKRELILREYVESNSQLSFVRKETEVVKKTISHVKYRDLQTKKATIISRLSIKGLEDKNHDELSHAISNTEAQIQLIDEQRAELKALIALEVDGKKAKDLLCDSLSRKLEEFKVNFKSLNLSIQEDKPYMFYQTLKEQLSNQKTKVSLIKYSLEEFLPTMVKDSVASGRCFLCDRSLHKENTQAIEAKVQAKIDRATRNIVEGENELQYDYARFEQYQQHKREIKEFQRCGDQLAEYGKESDAATKKICDWTQEQKCLEEKVLLLKETLARLRELQNLSILMDMIDLSEIDSEFVCDPGNDSRRLQKLQAEESDLLKRSSFHQAIMGELEAKIASAEARVQFLKEKVASYKKDGALVDTQNEAEHVYMSHEEILAEQKKNKNHMEKLPYKYEHRKSELEGQRSKIDKDFAQIKACIQKIQGLRKTLTSNPYPQIKKQLEAQIVDIMESEEVVSRIRTFALLYQGKVDLESDLEKMAKEMEALESEEKAFRDKKKLFDEQMQRINEKKGQDSFMQSSLEDAFLKLEKLESTEQAYIQKLSKCEFHRVLIEDLEQTHRSLENALVEFHTNKIAEINKIIHSIWKAAYAGSDIETIKIFSECVNLDAGPPKPNAPHKKNYEYKVVFYSPDHRQLPMKGRSSAGQRMLASIVIRLALSEAFCINSGLLALDEPTTNLDEDNVRLLARFLKRLIKSREKQKSFQLIVITHDQEFVKMIGSSLEYYYLVSKDADGFSKIERATFEKEAACVD